MIGKTYKQTHIIRQFLCLSKKKLLGSHWAHGQKWSFWPGWSFSWFRCSHGPQELSSRSATSRCLWTSPASQSSQTSRWEAQSSCSSPGPSLASWRSHELWSSLCSSLLIASLDLSPATGLSEIWSLLTDDWENAASLHGCCRTGFTCFHHRRGAHQPPSRITRSQFHICPKITRHLSFQASKAKGRPGCHRKK